MRLRSKTLLATGITFVVLTAGAYMASRSWLLQKFKTLEERETKINVERVVDAIDQQLTDFHIGSYDWCTWDEAFRFMKDRNQAFIQSNLRVVTVKVDTMLFVANDGRLVFENKANRTPGVEPPNAQEILDKIGLKENGDIKRDQDIKGVIEVRGTPMMISVRPITRSNGTGPHRGWIVFALWYDQAELKALAERTHLGIEILPMPKTGTAAFLTGLGEGEYLSQASSESVISGYSVLNDIKGHPLRVIKTNQPRVIYSQAKNTVNYLFWGIAVACLVFCIVIAAVIEAAALSRVTRLSRIVELVGDEGRADQIQLSGNDELSWLAQKIQSMLNGVQAHREELKLNNQRLEATVNELASVNSILEHAIEAIAHIDLEGKFISANQTFCKSLGHPQTDIVGREAASFIHPSDLTRYHHALAVAANTGKASVELQGCRSDGSIYYFDLTVVAPQFSHIPSLGYHLFMKDISERKQLEMRIEHQAFHDSLTGMPNRALFMDRLAQAQTRAKRHGHGVSVVFMDLDNFKLVNDSMGHEAGDELLNAMAARLASCLRPEDTVARLGGDEFTVLLEGLHNAEEASEVAERIVESLRLPFSLSMGEIFAGASIGIAYSQAGDEDPMTLLRDADTAMYEAKAQGKAAFVLFDPSMNAAVVERMEIETGLRQALAKEELYLLYQPIVDLETGDICAAEALLRWVHPTRGLIMPDLFIPVAEETGLIVPIGEWVLREACRQAKEWQTSFGFPKPLSISVNLSGKQLQRPDIVERVGAILREVGLPPEYLKLEITESVILTDQADAVDKLRQLKSMGIRLAIDDFGTGYSSMSNLSSFPVDSVKIDRNFISRMGDEGEVDAIVAAIIFLSKTMRLAVTAEGLEDRNQLIYLQALGCHEGQGYYFDRPLTIEQVYSRLEGGLNVSMELEQRYKNSAA